MHEVSAVATLKPPVHAYGTVTNVVINVFYKHFFFHFRSILNMILVPFVG